MSLQTFTVVNRRLEEERRKQYCGTASLCLTSLQYQEKDPQTMRTIFRQESGCRKEDHRHHVKALINQQDLEAAMLNSSVSRDMLMADILPYPELEFPSGFKIECIEGHDRLAAADKVLQGSKKRWIVDLYLDDLSSELRMLLADGYDYQKKPDDGEIFVNIRHFQGYHGNINPFFENLWLARFATNKNSKKLFNQLTKNKKFSAAFDKLLDIPALFGGFRLSVIHQLLSMKCDEPNLAYLNHVFRWWSDIFADDKAAMRHVTRDTVMALQGTAPGACSSDRKVLLEKMKSGGIFENFSAPLREELWERICNATKTCLIPSLFTFFEDRKFLSDAAGAIRKMLDINRKGTIAGYLEEIFSDTNQEKDKCVIQISETTFGHIVGDSDTRLDLGIRQIWLAAFRNCREMPSDTQKGDLLALSRTKTDKTALYELSSLALKLGFESDKLKELSRESIDREIAENALLNARKPGIYHFPDWDRCIQQIVSIINSATPVSMERTGDIMMKPIRENYQLPNRCGRPNNTDYENDRTQLFLPQMSDDVNVEMGQMTSTFVRWSVYCAYFESPPLEFNLIEDDVTLLDVEFGECEKPHISSKGSNRCILKDKEELAVCHESVSHDMEIRLEQLKQSIVTEDQQPQEILQQIKRHNTELNDLSKKLMNERTDLSKTRQKMIDENTKLRELREEVALKQNELGKMQKQWEAEKQSRDAEIQKQVKTINQLKSKIASLKQKSINEDTRLKALRRDSDILISLLAEKNEELLRAKQKFEALKDNTDSEQKRHDEIEKTIKQKNIQLKCIEQNIILEEHNLNKGRYQLETVKDALKKNDEELNRKRKQPRLQTEAAAYIQESVETLNLLPLHAQETLHHAQKMLHHAQETPHQVQETLHHAKRTLHYAQKTLHHAQEILHQAQETPQSS